MHDLQIFSAVLSAAFLKFGWLVLQWRPSFILSHFQQLSSLSVACALIHIKNTWLRRPLMSNGSTFPSLASSLRSYTNNIFCSVFFFVCIRLLLISSLSFYILVSSFLNTISERSFLSLLYTFGILVKY